MSLHCVIFWGRYVYKVNGTEYPGKTLYHSIVSIQKHIQSNGKSWKIIEGGQFSQVRTVLNNLMKERAKANIGTVKHEVQFINSGIEKKLWDSGCLGDDTPDKLRCTVLFLLRLHVGLMVGDEHYDLQHDMANLPSQIQFEHNKKGVRCLVYREYSTTKTNDGGLSHM